MRFLATLAALCTACASGPTIETAVGPGLQTSSPPATATLAKDPRTLTFKELRFDPPKVARSSPTDSALTSYYAPHSELPLIDLALIVGLGSRDDPAAKPGVVELLRRTLVVGGAAGRDPDNLAETAESRAIELHVSVGLDRTTLRVAALSKDLPLAFELLADLARRPRYDEKRLEIERGRAIESVRRRNDRPQGIASRELRSALYGVDSRWARLPTQAQLKAVTQADILALHKRFFTAANSRLVVVGDVSAADYKTQLERWFAKWGGDKPDRPTDADKARPKGPIRRLAVKPGGQAVILAGQRWLPRHHPDRYASDLLNYILGGGVFQSRLGEAIRSDRGLAYSVSSGVRRLHEDQGYLYVFAGTKPESQGEVLALVHSVTDAMRAKADISAEELSRTKEAFLNRHIFNFDTAYGLAVQQAVLEHYGYDPDWLRTYPERIAAVTAADLARLANERLRPDQFATVLVTPKAPTEGDWTPIDLSEAVR